MKKLAVMLTGVLMCIVVIMVACVTDVDSDRNQITEFEVPAEVQVDVGIYYAVPSVIASDKQGKKYVAAIKVTDKDGVEISLEEGKFFVAKIADYTVTYTIVFEGENVSKTTMIKVSDNTAPIIVLPYESVLQVKGSLFALPDAVVSDNFDVASDVTLIVTAYHGENEVDIDEDNALLIEDDDEYRVVYKAVDRSGNSASKTLTITVIYEEDNITYFNRAEVLSALRGSSITSVSMSSSVVLPGHDNTVRVSATHPDEGAKWSAVIINTPMVKDISGYDYLYFYVYNAMEYEMRISFNQVYSYKLLAPQSWTKVVLHKDVQGLFRTPSGHLVFYGDLEEPDYSPVTHLDNPASAEDITGFKFVLQGQAGTTSEAFITAMYGSVGEPPVAVVDGISPVLVRGSTLDIPTATVDGSLDGITQKVYMQHGASARTEVTEQSVTLENEGTYTFVFEVAKDGVIIDIVIQNVLCAEEDADNISYFDKAFALDMVSSYNASLSMSDTVRLNDEQYSLKMSRTDNAAEWSRVHLDYPAITDVSGYDYLVFWVYNDSSDFVRLSYNNQYDYYLVQPQIWTRVVLTKTTDGLNFETPSAEDAVVFGVGGSISVTDISNFAFYVRAPFATAANVYFSAMRGTTQAPVTASAVFSSSTVEEGNALDIPTASLSASTGTVTQQVWRVNGAALTEIIDSSYTFSAMGQYKFAFEVFEDGQRVDMVYATVSCVQPTSDGKIAALDTPEFLGNASGMYGSSVVSHYSDEGIIEGEDGALRLTGNTDGFAGVTLTGFSENDLSAYSKLTFYVKNNGNHNFIVSGYAQSGTIGSDLPLTFNLVTPGQIIELTYEKDANGDFVMHFLGDATPGQDRETKIPAATAASFTQFRLVFRHRVNNPLPSENIDVLISGFYVE